MAGKLSVSEGLYGFVGWLTSRPERVVMSSKDDAECVIELVDKFCKANGLTEPREGWAENLIHPVDAT